MLQYHQKRLIQNLFEEQYQIHESYNNYKLKCILYII